jgi:hypothetical protein
MALDDAWQASSQPASIRAFGTRPVVTRLDDGVLSDLRQQGRVYPTAARVTLARGTNADTTELKLTTVERPSDRRWARAVGAATHLGLVGFAICRERGPTAQLAAFGAVVVLLPVGRVATFCDPPASGNEAVLWGSMIARRRSTSALALA